MAAPTRKKETRAPKGSLTEARILAAALQVLAREGLSGVGMRSVARELRTGPMSLYRHVRDRAALLELLKRRLIAVPPGAARFAVAGPWRERLEALLGGVRAQLRAHPGAVELFDSENFRRGPALGAVELALEALERAGLGAADADRVAATLWLFTVGSVLAEQSSAAAWPGEELAPNRRAAWVARTRAEAKAAAPRVARAAPRWAALSHDAAFARGLGLLLDGVAAAGRAARPGAEARSKLRRRRPARTGA